MEIAEIDDATECAECGELVFEVTRAFAFGERSILCAECAARRGGAYDPASDRWLVAPKLQGLDVADA
jgi:hypothetical protein